MRKWIKGMFFLWVLIFIASIVYADGGVQITSLNDLIKLRQLRKEQREADPYYSGVKAFCDGIQRGIEDARRKRKAEAEYQRQAEITRYKRETSRQRQKLEKLKAENLLRERENQFLERLEKEKNACRILYKDFDKVFVLGIDLIQADKTYQTIFSEKSQDPLFNTAEFIYKLGKLHPDYKE